MSKEKKEKRIPTFLLIILCIIPFAVIFGIWNYYGGHMLLGQTDEQLKGLGPGARGDMYGGLNTLFTGFAFAGLIIALLFQMKELKLQREELEASVDAQEKLADMMKESAEAQRSLAEAMRESVNKQAELIEATYESAISQHDVGEAMLLSAEIAANAAIFATTTEVLLSLSKRTPPLNIPLADLLKVRDNSFIEVNNRAQERLKKRRSTPTPIPDEED